MIEIISTEPTLLDKIRQISEHYSKEHQLVKAYEEVNELAVELIMAIQSDGNVKFRDNSWSEVADVMIMCIQLTMQHGKEDKVREQLHYKVDRQLRRIEAEKKKAAWQQGIMNRFTDVK